MDLKFYYCFLSLILLVAYGTEARKVVQGNSEDGNQQALKAIYGAEDNHQQEISGNKKLTIPFFFYKQANDEQVKKENVHIHSEHNHQQEISGNKKLAIPLFFDKEGNNEQVKRRNEHIMHSSSHTHMDDPSIASIFFLQDDLKMGKTVTLSFQKRINLISSPSNSPQNFFPKKAADSIPFSFKELQNLLQRFSLSENSPQAKSMEDALRICELSSPITGETQYCATSAEGMLDFVHEIMGEKTQVKTLSTTTHFSNEDSTPHPQNYTIVDVPQEVSAPKMVMCHILSCDYTVFYCHHTISDERKVSKVSLRNEANGDTVESIAVCHLDTSEWDPSHVSFRVLGVLPGASPICHFFPSSNDLVWVPKTGNEAL